MRNTTAAAKSLYIATALHVRGIILTAGFTFYDFVMNTLKCYPIVGVFY